MIRNIRKNFLIAFAFAALLGTTGLAQSKNEVGLVIGATETPGQTLSPGANLISPTGAVLPNRTINFDSSLALGAEFDHAFFFKKRVALSGGVDFLASPQDVKVSQQTQNAPREYASVFLTPHIRVKFRPSGAFSPWLSFGGGFARFLESKPTAIPFFRQGTNTGAFVFGGGVDTRTVVHVLRIPIGFRFEVRDFYSGQPNYNVGVSGGLQNNVAFTGGLLIRF